MQNWFLIKILSYAGKKLSGYKMYAGGAASILNGVIGLISLMFPDQGLPQYGLEASIGFISAGIAVIGGAHKIDKNTAAVVAQTQAIQQTTGNVPGSPSG